MLALSRQFIALGEMLNEWATQQPPIQDITPVPLDKPLFDDEPLTLRGKIEGRVHTGRLHDVQLPQKNGKSTKLFLVDDDGVGLTVYAGTFAFDPDDLMAYEGYDIEYSIKEIVKDDSRFTALASWKPLI